jgi:hypothetical protein
MRYFFDVCGALCKKLTPTLAVISAKLPGTSPESAPEEAGVGLAGAETGLFTCAKASDGARNPTKKATSSHLHAGTCGILLRFITDSFIST